MRPITVFLWLLAPLLALTWSADDHEIFRLADELRTLSGPNTTFYSFLSVPSTASNSDINTALRRRSRNLHPDKAIPSLVSKLNAEKVKAAQKSGKTSSTTVTEKEKRRLTKEANDRYAILPAIAGILRDQRRERYDYFLKNGFPKWRGTGYYYARFRPGFSSVVLGLLVVFGGGAHYGAMYISWKRRREFVERYVGHARKMAWGDESGIPGLDSALNGNAEPAVPTQDIQQMDAASQQQQGLNRKQKRQQEREGRRESKKPTRTKSAGAVKQADGATDASQNGTQTSARKKVVAENGKVLVVEAEGNVFLEEETSDGETHELLLDPDEIPAPRVLDTALFRLPVWMYSRTVGWVLGPKSGVEPDEQLLTDGNITMESPEAHSTQLVENSAAQNPNADARKRKAKAKSKK
ncbi:MAG: hypothetical protein Q9162_002219 [Coniocarpon cinnabarinum]